jgi:predicted metal-dependent hydrolase
MVHVTAPLDAVDDEIHERVCRKGGWISAQLEDFEQYRPRTPPRQYISGETHLLRGVQYRLRIHLRQAARIFVSGDRIVLETPHAESLTHKAALLNHFYRLEAHQDFPLRLQQLTPLFASEGMNAPKLVIREMTKRWGSYTPNGNLVLNLDLIRAPVQCIDYVIVHELAHAFEPDHGPRWRRLMDKVMPDWRERKQRLETSLM